MNKGKYFSVYIAFLWFALPCLILGQRSEMKQGKVTYVTSLNIYTEFSSTEGISSGDTLLCYDGRVYTPAVLIKFISSRSAAGPLLSGIQIKPGDLLFVKIKAIVKPDTVSASSDSSAKPEDEAVVIKEEKPLPKPVKTEEKLRGRAGIQSSTTMVNTGTADDNQRWRYTLSLTSQNVYIQGLTLGTHLNYAYSVKEWRRINSNPINRLIPYDLYASYENDGTGKVTVGRKISKWHPSLGAIDGVQYENSSAGYRYGAFAGARPSPVQYGFDFNLFQWGVFLSRSDSLSTGTMENTLAFVHQTNSFNTDRQFLSFQQYGNYFRWLMIYAAAEADFYKDIPGQSGGVPELTSIYIQARAKITREFQATVSYDARRNPVFYYTYRNLIDSSFSNPLSEGTRIQLNYRPLAYLTLNLSGGFRFRQGDLKTAVTYTGYAGWSKIPYIGGSTSYSYTHSEASYSSSDYHSILYRNDIGENFSWSAGLRRASYSYGSSRLTFSQNMLQGDLNWRFLEKTYLTFSIEESFSRNITFGRVYLDLTQRF